jgi:hypothetical protein
LQVPLGAAVRRASVPGFHHPRFAKTRPRDYSFPSSRRYSVTYHHTKIRLVVKNFISGRKARGARGDFSSLHIAHTFLAMDVL